MRDEYELTTGGQGPALLELPLDRLLGFIHGVLMGAVEPKKRREVENLLNRAPGETTELVPGVPIPAWMDDEDLPPEYRPSGET